MFRDSDFVASLARSETYFVLCYSFKILHTNLLKMQIYCISPRHFVQGKRLKKTVVYTLSLWLQHVKIDKTDYSYDIILFRFMVTLNGKKKGEKILLMLLVL